MESFIRTVLLNLKDKNIDFKDFSFVLPSKRAGVFLKHELSKLLEKPIFSPQIQSIEEFVEELSGLKKLSNTDLLFRLYHTYKRLTPKENQESFESFSKWAQILLQDFNEIDRFLVPHEYIFDYLNAIKELNHWSLETEQTELVKNHLKFWKRLKEYYVAFTEELLKLNQGYQGLIYREAAENLEPYIESNGSKTQVFLGFNALNTAESQIIQALLQSDVALIYWDIDKIFINDHIHDAGQFTRAHKNTWSYFKKHAFNWTTSNYITPKKINVVGIPKLIGQAKYIGELLENISYENKELKNVAVVLGEENLLMPLLNSIPKSISELNVTMGLPLKLVPLSSLFELLFSIHKLKPKKFYYKDIIDVISHPSLYCLFETEKGNSSDKIINHIHKNNLVYLSVNDLKEIKAESTELIELLFNSWEDQPKIALDNCLSLILMIKEDLNHDKSLNRLELEYLFRFHNLFNELVELNGSHKYLDSIASTYTIYNELLSVETLDFQGEPLEGLQIMGMLESRVLDFETVIISSVNEGILPSGKTNNSFIPFDVKVENGLPTFKEKDAVYTYHFFRLLQRAKNVYILYNTEVDTLKGGEKSRFITQLEIEGIHNINHKIIAPEVPRIKKELQRVKKTNEVIESIKELATDKGFSPSSLTNYIRNPIDFYFEKILKIDGQEDVEENIAANTLGSVIHNTLEDFYKPIEGFYLTISHLKDFKSRTRETVTKHLNNLYNKGDFSKGKNLIIFEIAQRYISNFIDTEIESLRSGNQIKIIAIEADETIEINIEDIDFPVKLNGKVDRIDQFNGVTRVIDYKSGKVEQNKVEIVDWEDITSVYDKYSKSFQILCYAYMMYKKNRITLPIEAGIISFKNLNSGFLKFGKKPSTYSKSKDQMISKETLMDFEIELKKLISEIYHSKIDFLEKELD